MKTNIWIIRLKVSTLIRCIRTGKKENIQRLIYLNAGKSALFLLKLFRKLKLVPFEIHRIEPTGSISGPVLHLHNVRDDQGKLLIMQIYDHILQIRRKITAQLIRDFKNHAYFLNRKPANYITAYIGMQAGQTIKDFVYVARYARWKYHDPKQPSQNVLIIPHSDWDDILSESLTGLVDRVIVESNRKECRARFMILLKSLVKSLFISLTNPSASSQEQNDRGQNAAARPMDKDFKIMTYYAMGVEPGKRNDISFLHDGNIEPSRLVLYFRYPNLMPNPTEKEWLSTHNIGCFADPEVAKFDKYITSWHPTPRHKTELVSFYRLYLKTFSDALHSRKTGSFWMLTTLWEMGKSAAYWKDFFMSHNIGMVVNSIPALENFIPNMVLAEIGGIPVCVERSILFDYCTYIHNPPCHISFVTGPYSLTQIPEPSFALNTIEVGSMNMESREDIQESRKNRGKDTIQIALFDEMPNDVFFGDSIRQFYQAFIDLVTEDPRFSLLIKTKKPQVLESMPREVREGLDRLTQQGRCIMAGWKVTALTAAAQSDIVACVPSTAAFESVLTRTRTILFNPMATGSSLFYGNNGLNRRVFEDSSSMLDALKRFADGKDNTVGDCTDIIGKIDPFNDGNGPARTGNYIQTCIDLAKENLPNDEIIPRANAVYIPKWGSGKFTHESGYNELTQVETMN